MKLTDELETLIVELFNIGCVKFGEFTLKSGIKSPIYFDLRLLVSHPKLLKMASKLFQSKIEETGLKFELLCGVPYGAIPLVTALSIDLDRPMIFKRKDVKDHGTKCLIEGVYQRDQSCLVVDDVISSGISIVETIESLRKSGVIVADTLVILDREQGGAENLKRNYGINLCSIVKSKDFLDVLLRHKKITTETYEHTMKFLNENNSLPLLSSKDPHQVKVDVQTELSFEARAKLCKNELTRELFNIMARKQTNLCLSADFTSFEQLLKAADELGPHICLLKTHVDILDDFDMNKVQQLVNLSLKHNFLIFEDRKFADIGNTVKMQYSRGVYQINKWAHIVNAHAISGQGCIKGLKEANTSDEMKSTRGCLLIAQLSSQNNLIDERYTNETVKMAEENQDFIVGFISQKKLSKNPCLIHMTPGVQFGKSGSESSGGDKLGQQYSTPESAIIENKCDLIIVGRGIIESKNQLEAALKYKQSAYDAYLKRIDIQ